jgi:hypothetical protein
MVQIKAGGSGKSQLKAPAQFGDKKRHPCSLLSANSKDAASRKGQEQCMFKELKCYVFKCFIALLAADTEKAELCFFELAAPPAKPSMCGTGGRGLFVTGDHS